MNTCSQCQYYKHVANFVGRCIKDEVYVMSNAKSCKYIKKPVSIMDIYKKCKDKSWTLEIDGPCHTVFIKNDKLIIISKNVNKSVFIGFSEDKHGKRKQKFLTCIEAFEWID